MSLAAFMKVTTTRKPEAKQTKVSARRAALALKLYEKLMQQAAIRARLFEEFHSVLYPSYEEVER